MGFRFRKSFNLGGGFRINLSKSGIGYSWGGKGFRFTKTARDTTRSTFSIPGTGISYTSESGRGRTTRSTSDSNAEAANVNHAEQTPPTNPYYNANGNRSTTPNYGSGYAQPFTIREQDYTPTSPPSTPAPSNSQHSQDAYYNSAPSVTSNTSFTSHQNSTSTRTSEAHSTSRSDNATSFSVPPDQKLVYPQPPRIPGPVHEELVKSFAQVATRNTLATWFLIGAIVVALALLLSGSTSPTIFLAPACALILKLGIKSQNKVNLDAFQNNQQRFQAHYKTLCNIATSKHAWRITQRQGITFTPNYKASDAELNRVTCTISTTVPEPLISSELCAVFSTPEETLVFHTDKLLILQQGKCVGVYGYADLKFAMTPLLFVETRYPIDDAHLEDTVWLHRTRSGAPDLRYNHNPQIPICRYGLLEIRGRTGLHVVLMFSNTSF